MLSAEMRAFGKAVRASSDDFQEAASSSAASEHAAPRKFAPSANSSGLPISLIAPSHSREIFASIITPKLGALMFANRLDL